jgi:hypothetical protein
MCQRARVAGARAADVRVTDVRAADEPTRTRALIERGFESPRPPASNDSGWFTFPEKWRSKYFNFQLTLVLIIFLNSSDTAQKAHPRSS